MTEWHCSNCDWLNEVDPTDTPKQYCIKCGHTMKPFTQPESLQEKDTQTDKL